MRKLFNDKSGFTVVEILVVVIIIGIISTLVVLSYTIYRKNAENAQAASVAQAYIDALNLYKYEKNNYPTFPEGYACLGEGYDLLNDGSKTCLMQSWGVSQIKESATFNTALRPYFPGGKLPKIGDYVMYSSPSSQYTGGYYTSDHPSVQWTLDGVRHPWFVIYFQEGAAAKCPVGPIATLVNIDGSGQAHLTSGVPSQGYTMAIEGKITGCLVPMPAIPASP